MTEEERLRMQKDIKEIIYDPMLDTQFIINDNHATEVSIAVVEFFEKHLKDRS